MVPLQANFFLITLRIFFWSNFLGRPWTVVKVLRPLRSVGVCQYVSVSVTFEEDDVRWIRMWM